MGLMIEGQWHDRWYETEETGGHFVRDESSFRGAVTADGSSGFPAEAGRYHLYVAHACPWAHRTLIFRRLKGLEEAISVSVVHPFMGATGWRFAPGPGTTVDHLHGFEHLHQLYTLARPSYSGRVTVPVLWDREQDTIVCNESSDIIRMLNSEFDDTGAAPGDYYPEALRAEIDEVNDLVYGAINNGVYRCGFATRQKAYEEAFGCLFDALDVLEARLSARRYLLGDRITEADWRLFTTLVRFDPVYFGHFKCNRNRLVDMPNLWGYVRDLFQVPGIPETVHMDSIKQHYYSSHESINPSRIVPAGPRIDYMAPHHRHLLPASTH